jgi:hypothetical protein
MNNQTSTSIEFTYNSLGHVVRTVGIQLSGRGVTQHHAAGKGNPFNIYAMTTAAFRKIAADHPEMKVY